MRLDLVDVFGSRALAGNPLAVVRGGDALSGEAMLALTRWLGFSETTFLLPPSDPAAEYRVRIFYPGGELDFAGHPTLGSCHAWLAAGGVPRTPGMVVQQCGVGRVEVRQEADGSLAFAAPPMRRDGPLSAEERVEAARVAGVSDETIVDARWAENGPRWQLLVLRSVADLLAATPLPKAPTGTDIGLAAPAFGENGVDWELRAIFADQHGRMMEDPVTGSFNAGVACYVMNKPGAPDRLAAAQGRCVGADGRISWSRDGAGTVWIGGKCAMIVAGGELAGWG